MLGVLNEQNKNENKKNKIDFLPDAENNLEKRRHYANKAAYHIDRSETFTDVRHYLMELYIEKIEEKI